MADALREIFVEFLAEFDFEQFDKANKETDKLKDNLGKSLPRAGKKTERSSGKLAGKLQVLESNIAAAGFSTAALSSAIAFLINPITIVIALIGAAVIGMIALANGIKNVARSAYDFVVTFAEVGGEIASVTERIGISVEALQGWRQAAIEAGRDGGVLDDALTDLAEKMGDAVQNPTSEVAKNFKRLGISMRELRDNSVEDVFIRVAEGIKNLDSEQRQVYFSNQLMSEAGRQLVPVFKQGEKGLRGYIDQVKLAQPELALFVENSVEVSKEQAKLNQAWEGSKQILFNLLAPAVIWVTMKIRELTIWFNNNEAALTALKFALIALTIVVGMFAAAISVVVFLIGTAWLMAMWPIIAALGIMATAIGIVVLAIQDLYVFLQGGDSVFERFLSLIFEAKWAMQDWITSFFDTDSAIGRMLDSLSELVNGVLKTYNAFAKLTGLPELKVDFRRTIRDKVAPTGPRDDRFKEAQRLEFIQGVRKVGQNLTGVEQFESDAELYNRRLRFAGFGPINRQHLASPSVVTAARQQAARNVSVSQNNYPTFNISEVQNPQQIVDMIRNMDAERARDIASAIGSSD